MTRALGVPACKRSVQAPIFQPLGDQLKFTSPPDTLAHTACTSTLIAAPCATLATAKSYCDCRFMKNCGETLKNHPGGVRFRP
jgi:hypothetical protein